jgi:hypothetical protein
VNDDHSAVFADFENASIVKTARSRGLRYLLWMKVPLELLTSVMNIYNTDDEK